ncbi:MAG: 50S ribosomal protein L22 [Candidatus Komeilibacteria bacterium]
MEVKASVKHLRLSPTKTRLVIDNIRGKKAVEAVDILRLANQKPAKFVLKVLQSAIANAVNNFSIKEDTLIVKSVMADGGPVLKRMFPRAHGRADVLRKPMTHIKLVLEGEEDKKAKASKKADKSEIVKAEDLDVKGDTKKVKDMAKTTKAVEKAKSGKKSFNFQRKAGER